MTQAICILGRQPGLGMAELESLFGSAAVQPLGNSAALLDVEPGSINFGRLGGTVKLAKLLTILDTTNWDAIEKFLKDSVAPHTDHLAAGKLHIGLSVYGLPVKPTRINATALTIKKTIQDYGRPVRIVPNKTAELSSAQVLHNDLAGPRGWELLFIRDSERTYVAQTVAIQDINAYAARDQERPKRDARVGMLPPKLAQIIINLANPQAGATVLDPFCGTGVILQEALLMDFDVCGTDLEPRMVEFSEANILWLREKYPELSGLATIHQGDATDYRWPNGISVVACETYLGRPLAHVPAPEVLDAITNDVDTIIRKFLRNLAGQTAPGFRATIAVPAWRTKNGFKHLKTLASLENLGYTRTSFVHVSDQELIYHRPEQIVARELVVVTRK